MTTKDLPPYAGKILRINLSNKDIRTETAACYVREWLGGSGMAVKILYDELRPWVTPYDPANRIIFGAGALVGTTAPGACKSNMSSLSPVTGGWGSGLSDSYTGGQLKYAGYDAIILEGKAHTPVYLRIHNDRVEIRDAAHLWGRTTWETLDVLRKELGDSSLHILSIGPAGENLVRGSCIIQDRARAFGRCGLGAVMGAKNLKAIVVRGTGAIKAARPKQFMKVCARIREKFRGLKNVEGMRKYGTLHVLEKKQATCALNYKNFQQCIIPEEMIKVIDPRRTIEKYQMAPQSFPGCVIGCGRHLDITEGPYAGLQTECNQTEVLLTLQTRLAIWEPTFMMKANALCNQLGLDVDAAGGAIGWAMECTQRGILNEKDTDGQRLNWGDAEVVLELIRKIGYREGFGNVLAEGCARAADIIGRDSAYYAMHIKRQDLYEPLRGSMAWCLATTTSTRGGGHTTGAIGDYRIGQTEEEKAKAVSIFGVPNPDKFLEYEGKGKMVMHMEALHRINNCFGICHFHSIFGDMDLIDLPQLAELFSAATGWETSAEDLKHMAMRQLNLEKAFNLRHTDFDRKDDLPTPRDLREPIPAGALAGWKIDTDKFNQMLDEYYDLHGWDRETSFPKRETLVALNLASIADDLEKIGKLR